MTTTSLVANRRFELILFPFAALLNSFSITAMLLISGLLGHSQQAAEIGIIQGAMLALFYAFSGNARNLILAHDGERVVGSLFVTRTILVLPLALLVVLLVSGIDFVTTGMIAALLVRRVAEWFGEISLAMHERNRNVFATWRSILFELSGFLFCLLGSGHADLSLPMAMIPWALAPFVAMKGANISAHGWNEITNWRALMPHFGSTAVIGAGTYIFRISIALLAGKLLAGDLFTAFAIGGMVPTLFGQLLAPTLLNRSGTQAVPKAIFIAPLALAALGAAIVAGSNIWPESVLSVGRSLMFWHAIGWSIVGGAIMFVAVLRRTRLIQQGDGRSVFGPDLLSNLLIATCVPFVYHIMGPESLAGLYALSASMSLVFMAGSGRRWDVCHQYKSVAMHVVAFLLVIPVFVQVGGGIFRDVSTSFSTEGNIFRLPVPLSVGTLFIGIALLGNYVSATRSMITVFFSGLLMVMSAILSSHGVKAQEIAKLTLLAQYLLPVFALVLGEMYGHSSDKPLFEKAALAMMVLLIPLHLAATWLQGYWFLVPSLFVFSIYQYSNYFPMIVASIGVMTCFSLDGAFSRAKPVVYAVLPLVFTYVVASRSMTAILGLTGGVLLALLVKCAHKEFHRFAVIAAISIVLSAGYSVMANHEVGEQKVGVADVSQSALDVGNTESQWDNSKVSELLIGHSRAANRRADGWTSTYWLDALFNFGMLALIPLIVLTTHTVYLLWKHRGTVMSDPMLTGVAWTFGYILVVENTVREALRQPYSGIFSFFVWGLLLARLKNAAK